MGWPQSQDYNEAIQNAKSCFKDPELSKGAAVTNALGMPMPCSGNFADVYQVHCPETNTRWAIKCFTRGNPEALRQRYAHIDQHLQQAKLPFTVGFRFLEEGIRVRNQWHPVLKMQWVEGYALNHFVRDNLDKPHLLDALLQIWVRMAKRLREADMAHADLQHGNVLFVPGSGNSVNVKLIDYDGMWVPALAGQKSGEVGHPAYQHTRRLHDGTYSKEVDRFPLLVVATALRCLRVVGQPLWEKFDNGDNLLFREADLAAPEHSPVFTELAKIQDSQARKLVETLRQGCAQSLEDVAHLDELLADVLPVKKSIPKADPPVAASVQPKPMFEDLGGPPSAREAPSPSRHAPALARQKRKVIAGGVGAVMLAMVLFILFKPSKDPPKPPTPSFPHPPPITLTLAALPDCQLAAGESVLISVQVDGSKGSTDLQTELTDLPAGVLAEHVNSYPRNGRAVWRLKANTTAPTAEQRVTVTASIGDARVSGGFILTVERLAVTDLLKLINTEKHALRGKWLLNNQGLTSDDTGNTLLQIPYIPPAEYRLRIVAKRLESNDGIHVGLITENVRLMAVIDGWPPDHCSGLDLLDGRVARENETKYAGALFTNGKANEIIATVRKTSITVAFDGKEIIKWTIAPNRISLRTDMEIPDRRSLFFGTHSPFQISTMELTALSGRGRVAD